MNYQPYGPIEQALAESTVPEISPPKTNGMAWWGVVIGTIMGVAICYYIFTEDSSQRDRPDTP